MQTRENALHQWLKSIYPTNHYTLTPLAGDASFRRYYRLQQAGPTLIIMDAPPDKIKLAPFVYIRALLAGQGVCTPQIYAMDETLGFALLEDFGNVLLQNALEQPNSATLYRTAIHTLIQIQRNYGHQTVNLQTFDQTFMLQELSLFQEWFLKRYLGLNLEADEHQLLDETFQILTSQIEAQPRVLVHRDYHSRNIMLLEQVPATSPKFGIIDFQDAVLGPITYDLVSLLKDCYIQLSRKDMIFWLQYFYEQANLSQDFTFTDFHRAFDWCGLQRHIRILGTFARLHLRDGKSNYLQDLPRTFQYVVHGVEDYPEFQKFKQWLHTRVAPGFKKILA